MTPQSIAVVGAGIVGVATAEWLRRDGHTVTLIDRIDPGTPAQTSFGNAGILAGCAVVPVPVPGLLAKIPKLLLDPMGPLHLKWAYLPRLLPWLIPFLRRANKSEVEATAKALSDLIGDTADQHLSLAQGTPAEAYIRPGSYTFLYPTRADYEKDALGAGLRAANGFRMRELDRADLLQEDPHIGPHYSFAASYLDQGWITDPGAYTAALFGHFRTQGGAFHQGEVDDIRPMDTGAEIAIAGEALTVDRVVLAGGVWSAKLAGKLGHKAKMESERGYHLVLEGANRRPFGPYMLTDAKFAATPMDAGLRCAGQVEFGGLKAGMSEAPFRVVNTRVKQLYPDLTWQGESRWLGHRPSTVDSLPLIGPSPKTDRIHFAFGAQHVGLTSGPKTGRIIADQIAGRMPNIDLTPFRVGRFD